MKNNPLLKHCSYWKTRIYFHDVVLGNLKLIFTAPSTKKERGRGEKKKTLLAIILFRIHHLSK